MQECRLALIVLALPFVGAADPIPATLTFDEFGNGIFESPVLGPAFSPGFPFFDPGPGGLCCAVLTYDLLGPPSLVAGDVILVEPGKGSAVSDLIRFNPDGTGGCGCYPASLVFYSDDLGGVNAVGDTRFPTAQYTNVVTLTETGGGFFGYTPTAGQPGFVQGFDTTYNFISDIPEPASASCLLITAGVVWAARRLARPET